MSQTFGKTTVRTFDKCFSDSSNVKVNETSMYMHRFSVRGLRKRSKVNHVKRNREPSRLPVKKVYS